MEPSKRAVDVNAASDHYSAGDPLKGLHEHSAVMFGESDHVDHYIRAKLLELLPMLCQLIPVTQDAIHLFWETDTTLSTVKHRDPMPVPYQMINQVRADETSSTDDKNLHGLKRYIERQCRLTSRITRRPRKASSLNARKHLEKHAIGRSGACGC